GAAVFLGDRRTEQPELSHFGDDIAVEAFVAVGLNDPGKQFVLGIAARGVAHHALFLGQLTFEVERGFPVERCILGARGPVVLTGTLWGVSGGALGSVGGHLRAPTSGPILSFASLCGMLYCEC